MQISFSEALKSAIEFSGLSATEIERRSRILFSNEKFHIRARDVHRWLSPERERSRLPSAKQVQALASILEVYPKEILYSYLGSGRNRLIQRLYNYPGLVPPFSLNIADAVHFRTAVDPLLLDPLIPEGVRMLQRINDLVDITFVLQNLHEVHAGMHAESLLHIPVNFKGEKFRFVVKHFIDSPHAMLTVREVYGYPSMHGHTEIKEEAALLTISGLPLLKLAMGKSTRSPVSPSVIGDGSAKSSSKESRGKKSRIDYFGTEKLLLHKQIPAPDGKSLALDQLVSFVVQDEPELDVTEVTKGRPKAELHILSQALSQIYGITDGSPFYVRMWNFTRTMFPGRVIHDYLKQTASASTNDEARAISHMPQGTKGLDHDLSNERNAPAD